MSRKVHLIMKNTNNTHFIFCQNSEENHMTVTMIAMEVRTDVIIRTPYSS